MPFHPKLMVREKIPPDFARFMKDVAEMIAANDEATTIESDDLIQWDDRRGSGGLYDEVRKRFGFDFRLDAAYDEERFERNIVWTFDLSVEQIIAIGNGQLREIDLWRCTVDCGRRFCTSDSYCPVCDFPP